MPMILPTFRSFAGLCVLLTVTGCHHSEEFKEFGAQVGGTTHSNSKLASGPSERVLIFKKMGPPDIVPDDILFDKKLVSYLEACNINTNVVVEAPQSEEKLRKDAISTFKPDTIIYFDWEKSVDNWSYYALKVVQKDENAPPVSGDIKVSNKDNKIASSRLANMIFEGMQTARLTQKCSARPAPLQLPAVAGEYGDPTSLNRLYISQRVPEFTKGENAAFKRIAEAEFQKCGITAKADLDPAKNLDQLNTPAAVKSATYLNRNASDQAEIKEFQPDHILVVSELAHESVTCVTKIGAATGQSQLETSTISFGATLASAQAPQKTTWSTKLDLDGRGGLLGGCPTVIPGSAEKLVQHILTQLKQQKIVKECK